MATEDEYIPAPTTSHFTIGLFDEGDEGAAFRLRNGVGELQRPYILDRNTSYLNLQGDLVNVVHGTLTPGGKRATLIISEFRFLSSDRTRKFRHAVIKFIFSQNETQNAGCPKVLSIAPEGHYSINVTRLAEMKRAKLGIGIEVSSPLGVPGKIHGEWKWEAASSVEKNDRGSLVGLKRVEGKFIGKAVKNSARWTLSENQSQNDGLPTFLRVAVLVELQNDCKYEAEVEVTAKVDTAYAIKNSAIARIFKGERVDPIIFDPVSPPLGDLPTDIDLANLSTAPISNLWKLQTTTVISSPEESYFEQ
ncbi:hypothetical protein DFH27DRAFT_574589 [Peziza echinospora]|nr:hypothetical protein DFH27DRAFT_574589 [Peziza echinospora]